MPVSLHHRRARGSGGSKDSATNGPANLLYLCGSGTSPHCHGWIESHRTAAYNAGWLVHSWDDPARVPVAIVGRGPVLLTADGRYGFTLR
jgi:hypothetical protein